MLHCCSTFDSFGTGLTVCRGVGGTKELLATVSEQGDEVVWEHPELVLLIEDFLVKGGG